MENYPLAVMNLHKLLPAKYLSKEEKVPYLRFRKVSRFRGGWPPHFRKTWKVRKINQSTYMGNVPQKFELILYK